MTRHHLESNQQPATCSPRRSLPARRKTFALSIGLIAVVATFSITNTFITQFLPELLSSLGHTPTVVFLASSIAAGIVSGVAYLLSNTLEQARRRSSRPVWTPYGIRNTPNARRCRSYSITGR